MDNKKRPIFQTITDRIFTQRQFIQVLMGPRQVGKTTLALQLIEELSIENHYATADSATLEDQAWIRAQWDLARLKAKQSSTCLLVIDEVQKIPHWSDSIKLLWDEDSKNGINIKVLLLGSSPWLMQQGLTESLAGRFEIIPVTHWSYAEMKQLRNWSLEDYLYFGGYPGAAKIADRNDCSRWINYINDALIETTISRDILLMTQVNKPALLRRLFQLGCQYSGQMLSYQKMLGQLKDAGNTTTLAHYLELLSGAGLLTGLEKFANQAVRKRASSPKFQVFNTALMTATSHLNFSEAFADKDYWGRLVESAIGSHILNNIRGKAIKCYYWREGNYEVDFVLQSKNKIIALEVKSTNKRQTLSGMQKFIDQFSPYRTLLIGHHGISIEEFLLTDMQTLFE